MTPAALARLHALCFSAPPPWSEASFAALLESPHVFVLEAPGEAAFALGRAIGPEAELLTLATHPAARRKGLAQDLMTRFEAEARSRGAESLFLEVAADNIAARALYDACGYALSGRRRGYYADARGAAVDALILCKSPGCD